jgi:predicted Fe-S protein YdhL (DUF1289 family)
MSKEVESPCISICTMDEMTGFCQGCYRTIKEIEKWWDLDNNQKQAIVDLSKQRELSAFE